MFFKDYFDETGLAWFNWPVEYFVSDKERISEFLPPILAKNALDGELCLRNFALLAFGKKDSITCCFTEAYTILSIYNGIDKSEPYGKRYQLSGSILEQAKKQ